MKALTIWQPWATLIMEGGKPNEYRRWSAPKAMHNKRIVIHAGKAIPSIHEIRGLVYRLEKDDPLTGLIKEIALPILERLLNAPDALPRAAALGTVRLGVPKKAIELHGAAVADSSRIDEHIYGWPVGEIERWAPPVPSRGFQGFWPYPASMVPKGALTE